MTSKNMTASHAVKSACRTFFASLATTVVAGLSLSSQAATTITVDSVVQRWPWNNKVDITYTVNDGQDVANSKFCRIVFTTVIDGKTYTIDGVSDLGASANTGTHTVTWTLPSGVKRNDCTMSAAIYAADAPSGDDYMVIDLASGKIAYEGLLASQPDSNARYNTDTYKADKLVLRKVPRWAERSSLPNAASLPAEGYPTGDSDNFADGGNANTDKNWNTSRAYYIGVFPVTQAQYKKLGFSNPSRSTMDITGNTTLHRPVETVSWLTLRNQATPTVCIGSDKDSTSFFERLNYRTGRCFDLPTEVMFEIAERAGVSGVYWWGNDTATDYVVSKEDALTNNGSGAGKSSVAVGMKKANGWGLYDVQGNVLEWCLDDKIDDDMALHKDPFTPVYGDGDKRRARGAGNRGHETTSTVFRSSYRANAELISTVSGSVGFRVSFIAD